MEALKSQQPTDSFEEALALAECYLQQNPYTDQIPYSSRMLAKVLGTTTAYRLNIELSHLGIVGQYTPHTLKDRRFGWVQFPANRYGPQYTLKGVLAIYALINGSLEGVESALRIEEGIWENGA